MRRNDDFFDLEDEIRNSLDNAFNYINYGGMRDHLNRRIFGTIDEIRNSLNKRSDYSFKREKVNGANEEKNYANFNNKTKSNKNVNSPYISTNPKGKISGIIYSILGIGGSIVWGIGLFSVIIGSLFMELDSVGVVIFTLSAFIANLFLAYLGKSTRERISRFKKYSKYIEKKNYYEISKLAEIVRKSNEFVVKDLEKMISLDMFLEGHIDDEKTYFMLSNEIYDDYLKTKEAMKNKEEEKKKEEDKYEGNEELASVVKTGKEYIANIRKANDDIPGEAMSEKLYKLENIITSIFKNVEKNPSKLSEVKKFINHYLPITLKLVNSYRQLDNQSFEGENMKKAKDEIEKSIDLINNAFEKLLDDLFEDIAMDISSDISVLKTLFNQEGLTEDDFKKHK